MARKLSTYGYTNARIRARLSKRLSEEDLTDLMRAPSAEEAVQMLYEGPYGGEIGSYAETGDVRAVEFALMVHEMRSLKEVVQELPGRPGRFARTLLLRYEVETLKNALRLWFEHTVRGRNISGGSSYLYGEKIVNELPCDAIVDAEDESRVVELLEGTPYGETVSAHMEEVRHGGHLFPVEMALDRFFFQRLLTEAQALDAGDRDIALRILGVEVDLLNIDRTVRFISSFRRDQRGGWDIFLPGGSIPKTTLNEAYRSEDPWEAISTLLSRHYGDYRGFAQRGSSGSPYTRLQMVEELLRSILSDEVGRLLTGYPFTIATVLAYHILKRQEVRAVVTILNAKRYGIDEARIREML